MDNFAVEMRGVTKTFGDGFKANDSVNFSVRKAEIHALAGENGAGKTTLMNILYGMYKPDSGIIKINNKEVSVISPSTAISAGIGMVHQHFMLAGTLTVLENIILGSEITGKLGLLDFKKSTNVISGLLEKFRISIDLNAKAGNLPVGTQQKIEILKLLYRNAEILILDEPTAVLTPQEIDGFFLSLKELQSGGKTIILISHKLNEVLSVSNSITVLRHGKVTGNLKTSETGSDELTGLIIGGSIESLPPVKKQSNNNTLLSVNNITVLNDRKIKAVKNVSFSISEGEILGIAGVEGNGQTELAEAITGLREINSGTVKINNTPVSRKTVTAHIPANRHKHGIVTEYSVSGNVILGRQREREFSTSFKLDSKAAEIFAGKLVKQYDIRPANPEALLGALSGGNQQKVVVSRELTKDTALIVASHPARGLDIKATAFVHKALINERIKGKAILLVSSDLTELIKLSDKIAVMYNGEIAAILDPQTTNEHEIGMYMTGIKSNKK